MEQLEKEAFRMAAGGEKGCTLASDPGNYTDSYEYFGRIG